MLKAPTALIGLAAAAFAVQAMASIAVPTSASNADETGHLPVAAMIEHTNWEGTFSVNNCDGFTGSMVWPGHTSPARVPPGWEDPPGTAASENLYLIFRCERVNIGPLERGPVSYVWEWTNGIRAPEACRFDGSKATWYTVNFMVDDDEVADYMEQEMGMTILRGTIDITREIQNGIGTTEASWHIDGAPAASYARQIHHGIITGVAKEHYRVYWDNGQGVTVSHWDHDAEIHMTKGPTKVSQFQAPWTHSQLAGGQADILKATHMIFAIGEYTEFGDFDCSKPRQRS